MNKKTLAELRSVNSGLRSITLMGATILLFLVTDRAKNGNKADKLFAKIFAVMVSVLAFLNAVAIAKDIIDDDDEDDDNEDYDEFDEFGEYDV